MSSYKQIPKAQLQGLLTSIPVYCASTVFYVAGQAFTSSQIVTLINAILNAGAANTAARAAWTAAMQAEEKILSNNAQVVREVRDTVALMFSTVPTTLSAFAILPHKIPKPLSSEARAAATAKLRATRIARGTTSKKEKAKISGGVTGVTITPTTTASASTPAATPAPTPSLVLPVTVVNAGAGVITPHS
jgi:hypothetical protein